MKKQKQSLTADELGSQQEPDSTEPDAVRTEKQNAEAEAHQHATGSEPSYTVRSTGQSLTADSRRRAITERGTRLDKYSEADVELSLRTLILSGGNVAETTRKLAVDGVLVTVAALRYWRDSAFSVRFNTLRAELAQEVGEEIAGRAMERALQADDAESLYIAAAAERVGEVSPDRLAAAARDLAKAKAENIGKAQLLRSRPTEIKEVRDIGEILEVFRRNGVLIADPRAPSQAPPPQLLDGEAKERDGG